MVCKMKLNQEQLIENSRIIFEAGVNNYSFIGLDEQSVREYEKVLSGEGYITEVKGPSLDCSVLKDRELFSLTVFRRVA